MLPALQVLYMDYPPTTSRQTVLQSLPSLVLLNGTGREDTEERDRDTEMQIEEVMHHMWRFNQYYSIGTSCLLFSLSLFVSVCACISAHSPLPQVLLMALKRQLFGVSGPNFFFPALLSTDDVLFSS